MITNKFRRKLILKLFSPNHQASRTMDHPKMHTIVAQKHKSMIELLFEYDKVHFIHLF